MTQQLTSSPRKTLDEASLQELLAAAHVVQKHNDLSPASESNYADVIAEVLRIQKIIRNGRLNLLATARLICQQVEKFTHASGSALGIVVDNELTYLAAIGDALQETGSRTATDNAISAYSLCSGKILKSVATDQDTRIPVSARVKADVRSLIAVPVEFENKVVGVLEARFNTPNAFQDDDIQICEFLAELVNELIIRAGHGGFSPVVKPGGPREQAGKHISSIEAETPAENGSSRDSGVAPTVSLTAGPIETQAMALSELKPAHPKSLTAGDTVVCRGCGENLTSDKLFCGTCGTERASKPDDPLQKKLASMWFMNQAQKTTDAEEGLELFDQPRQIPDAEFVSVKSADPGHEIASSNRTSEEVQPTAAVRLEWLPAAAASENWLRHQWRVNRANFYLAGAAFLLIMALSGVGTTPVAPANPNRPKLTLFESMLISLGLAEPPAKPVYQGNPNTPVWIDMHTAQYYCPGSDLYGKTDGGKIATQRDAQLDQFEPAHRRACN